MTADVSVLPASPAAQVLPAARVDVVEAGMFTTLQDLGRPGYAHLGIPESGGADRTSLTLANRLVGNADGATVFETTMGLFALELSVDRYVAVTGASVEVRIDGDTVSESHRTLLKAGQILSLGRPMAGLRNYVAVSGGVSTEVTFGSSSSDCLSGLGPARVRNGSTYELGGAAEPPHIPLELIVERMPSRAIDLSFHWGPRDALFAARDLSALVSTSWTVSAECDRVGVRLDGPPLDVSDLDIPSEGMALGSIQVPPSGNPIIFLADHPVTGGYPVIGVVTERDIDLLAQAAPGTIVRLSGLPRGAGDCR